MLLLERWFEVTVTISFNGSKDNDCSLPGKYNQTSPRWLRGTLPDR